MSQFFKDFLGVYYNLIIIVHHSVGSCDIKYQMNSFLMQFSSYTCIYKNVFNKQNITRNVLTHFSNFDTIFFNGSKAEMG